MLKKVLSIGIEIFVFDGNKYQIHVVKVKVLVEHIMVIVMNGNEILKKSSILLLSF
jgi:hypothetical protein